VILRVYVNLPEGINLLPTGMHLPVHMTS
jgi:hypothetical protein